VLFVQKEEKGGGREGTGLESVERSDGRGNAGGAELREPIEKEAHILPISYAHEVQTRGRPYKGEEKKVRGNGGRGSRRSRDSQETAKRDICRSGKERRGGEGSKANTL